VLDGLGAGSGVLPSKGKSTPNPDRFRRIGAGSLCFLGRRKRISDQARRGRIVQVLPESVNFFLVAGGRYQDLFF